MQVLVAQNVPIDQSHRWGEDLVVGFIMWLLVLGTAYAGFSTLSILLSLSGIVFLFGAAKRGCEIIVPATFWFSFLQVLPVLFLDDRQVDSFYLMPEGSMLEASALVASTLFFGSWVANLSFRRSGLSIGNLQGSYLASIPSQQLLYLYLAFSVAETLGLHYLFGPFVQQALAVLTLRYVFAVCLLYRAVQGESSRILYILVAIEVCRIPFSIYATFKELFLVLGIASVFMIRRFSTKAIVVITAVSVFLSMYGVLWSAVKFQHRARVAQAEVSGQEYSGAQKGADLWNDLMQLNANDLSNGVNVLMNRLSYTTFTAYTMSIIPSQKSFFEGELLLGALEALIPRALYADKKIQNDSDLMNQITELGVSGIERGTSISLGYIGETYADFGLLYVNVVVAFYMLLIKLLLLLIKRYGGRCASLFLLTPLVGNLKLEMTFNKMLAMTVNYSLTVVFILVLLNYFSDKFRLLR